MAPASLPTTERGLRAFLHDTRFIQAAIQVGLILILVAFLAYFASNVSTNLRASNIPMGWNYLSQTAGFEIAEGANYDPSQSYARAFVVGVLNTIRVVAFGIVLATLVGVFVGIARLSSNWLVRMLAGAYVEILRNTPLLVQLFFWYSAVILQLPDIKANVHLGNLAIISNRGVALAWPYLTATGGPWLWWIGAGLLVAIGVGYWRRRVLDAQGRLDSALPLALAGLAGVAAIGFLVTALTARLPEQVAFELRRGDRGALFVDADGDGVMGKNERPLARVPVTILDAGGAPLGTTLTDSEGAFRFFDLPVEGVTLTWEAPSPVVVTTPALQGFNVRGGRTFSPEFVALLLGLTLYTGAFIAEIVRAGINAVPHGQWEASRAVGLKSGEILRLIVLPQALRVIIPPLTSQYLNLTKNSSLAIAVGYPDLFNISLTIMNQSGATVQMFLIIMATYLVFSLATSAFMNAYNRRMALVER